MNIEDALPRLAAAYHRGSLVPFLGAGMSAGVCPDWKTLVTRLEDAADIPEPPSEKRALQESADAVVRRANHAIRVLTRRGPQEFTTALRRALYAGADGGAAPAIPPQTQAVAKLWWPLVLTTNYDDLFPRAYEEVRGVEKAERSMAAPYGRDGRHLEVLGRSEDDGQRVLASLSETTTSILWALHGYLPASARSTTHHSAERLSELAGQVVLGHEEYRRIAHASVHYRRAFAEVHQRRSFLFLGASLSDVYLLDMFAEVRELYGPSAHAHYAMVLRNTVDVDFLRTRFNIIALEYDDHTWLPKWLGELGRVVKAERSRPSRWSFDVLGPDSCADNAPALELRRGSLPSDLPPNECLVVGAALDGGGLRDGWTPFFGNGIAKHLAEHYTSFHDAALQDILRQPARSGERDYFERLLELPERGTPKTRVAVVTAWSETGRDLRAVGEATRAALAWAAGRGYMRVHLPLLATGTSAHFAPRFALAEIVRAYGEWRRASNPAVGLTLHLLSPSALFELTSGRLDVVELLQCQDLRFWVEVAGAGTEAERELVFCAPAMTVGELATGVARLSPAGWTVTLEPPPETPAAERRGPEGRTRTAGLHAHDVAEWTLLRLGVLPGTTLRFTLDDAASGTTRRSERDAAGMPAVSGRRGASR